MVMDNEERREKKEYSLVRIKELASQGNVRYMSKDVFRDTENLSYSPKDVHECLSRLDDEHYKSSVRYEGRSWLDEYLISYTGPTGHIDELYIKLKLDRDCIVVQLASFHREGAL